MRITTRQGDTLDAICYRHYGYTQGCVEAVLEAHPGLAALGPLLPMGTLIDLPDFTPAAQTTQTVQLWT
jgi:phage tail protein X